LHCVSQVHTFDPTNEGDAMVLRAAAFGYHYHTIGLGSQQQSDNGEQLGYGPLLTLQQIMEALNHTGRTIDIFKMDCEGCEFQTLPDQVFEPMSTGEFSVGQLQVEIHIWKAGEHPLQALKPFFEGADDAGLRIFHKERNHWACDGYQVTQKLVAYCTCVPYTSFERRTNDTLCNSLYMPPCHRMFAMCSAQNSPSYQLTGQKKYSIDHTALLKLHSRGSSTVHTGDR
jgi:Methyltransferase domain